MPVCEKSTPINTHTDAIGGLVSSDRLPRISCTCLCGGKNQKEDIEMSIITIKQLLEAGVHFGHHTRRWNPKMQEYIFTENGRR